MVKSKGGRPKLKLCKIDIVKLAKHGLTNEEVADVLNCSADTLENRFSGSLKEGRSNLAVSLKRAQLNSAINEGNTTMLIWCGKQWLGQRDGRYEVQHNGDIVVNVKHFGTGDAKPWKG